MPETIALPAPAPAEIPIAQDSPPSELARFRAAMREGKIPDLAAPAPPQPEPAAAPALPAPDDVDDEPGTKAPSKRQQYINELIRAQTRAELERDQLRERVEALERGDLRAAEEVPPTRPKPQEIDVGTTYATYADYIESLADWKLDQRDAATARAQAVSQTELAEREAVTAYQARVPAARTRHADFDEVTARPLPAPLTSSIKSALRASDIGPDLAYHLTINPEEYMRIHALPVGLALMAIGRLEERLQAQITPPAVSHSPISPPPAPMEPVGAGGTVAIPDGSKMTLAEFRAHKLNFGIA